MAIRRDHFASSISRVKFFYFTFENIKTAIEIVKNGTEQSTTIYKAGLHLYYTHFNCGVLRPLKDKYGIIMFNSSRLCNLTGNAIVIVATHGLDLARSA